jgi:hypothetical protein
MSTKISVIGYQQTIITRVIYYFFLIYIVNLDSHMHSLKESLNTNAIAIETT